MRGHSPNGVAVDGFTANIGIGVRGHSPNGTGVEGTSDIVGVRGSVQTNGFGVIGHSTDGQGVRGESTSGFGMFGTSTSGTGVRGISTNGSGVDGRSEVEAGVVGLGFPGVLGLSGGPLGRAGEFFGNVQVNGDLRVIGTLEKGGGGFRIDHPQNPANKYLAHTFVESDDMKNVYDGVAILDESGAASVELPSWFQELNGDYRYQLTPIGEAAPDLHIAGEVSENSFKIAGGHPGLKVCWQVTGIRQDPWANANRIEVEEDKADGERGHYLHPDLYGQPEEQGIGFAAVPEEVRLPERPSILHDPRLEEKRQQLEELMRRFPPPSQRTESSEE